MPNSHQIPWPRIIAEGSAIVVSILLAFSIDAWWDRFNSHQDEQIYLTTLKAALAQNQINISEQIAFAEALRTSARELLVAATEPASTLSDAALDGLLSDLTWYVSDPLTAELDSLLSDSSIARVSDPTVAYELGVLNAELAQFRANIRFQLDVFSRDLMPFLQDNVYLPQINNATEFQPGTNIEFPVNHLNLSDHVSHQTILNDHAFQNILVRWDWALTEVIEGRDSAIKGEVGSGIGRALEILQN